MIFNDYHSYIVSILNKKLIINRINDVKVLLASTSTLNLLFINASFEIHVRTTFFSFQTIYICTSKPNTQTLVNSLKMSSLKKWVVENKIVSSGPSMKLCSKPINALPIVWRGYGVSPGRFVYIIKLFKLYSQSSNVMFTSLS